jgi:hypothetical protein
MVKKLIGWPALLLGVLAGVWLWFSPDWQMTRFNEAIQTGDVQTVNDHMDYSAIQQDVIRQFKEQVAAALSREEISFTRATELSSKVEPLVSGMMNPGLMRESVLANRGKKATGGPLGMKLERTGLTTFTTSDGEMALGFKLQGTTWRAVSMDMSKASPFQPGALRERAR